MEQVKLTNENYKRLLKFQTILDNVKKTNTLKGAVRKNTMEISEIIGRKPNYSCGACVFRLYKQAADILTYNTEIRKKNGKRNTEKKQDKEVES